MYVTLSVSSLNLLPFALLRARGRCTPQNREIGSSRPQSHKTGRDLHPNPTANTNTPQIRLNRQHGHLAQR